MHPDIKTTKILEDRVKAMNASNNNKISPEIQEMLEKIMERWERIGIKFGGGGGKDKDAEALEKRAERVRKFYSILK